MAETSILQKIAQTDAIIGEFGEAELFPGVEAGTYAVSITDYLCGDEGHEYLMNQAGLKIAGVEDMGFASKVYATGPTDKMVAYIEEYLDSNDFADEVPALKAATVSK